MNFSEENTLSAFAISIVAIHKAAPVHGIIPGAAPLVISTNYLLIQTYWDLPIPIHTVALTIACKIMLSSIRECGDDFRTSGGMEAAVDESADVHNGAIFQSAFGESNFFAFADGHTRLRDGFGDGSCVGTSASWDREHAHDGEEEGSEG